MNRGLLFKALREQWPVTLLFGALFMGVEALLAYVLPTVQGQLPAQLLEMKFAQTMLRALLGADVTGGLGPDMLMAMAWVHPVPMALVWAHAIIVCTRVPAGEVDRGTIDVLLSLPVSRPRVLLTETAVWLAGGLFIVLAGLVGHVLGGLAAPPDMRAAPLPVVIIAANLFCLYAAIGAVAWLASALSDRRGRAVAIAFVFVLASFLLNYIAQFWKPAQRIDFLSLLSHYRPLEIIRTARWPLTDMAALAGAALTIWLAAGTVFTRRDLSAT